MSRREDAFVEIRRAALRSGKDVAMAASVVTFFAPATSADRVAGSMESGHFSVGWMGVSVERLRDVPGRRGAARRVFVCDVDAVAHGSVRS